MQCLQVAAMCLSSKASTRKLRRWAGPMERSLETGGALSRSHRATPAAAVVDARTPHGRERDGTVDRRFPGRRAHATSSSLWMQARFGAGAADGSRGRKGEPGQPQYQRPIRSPGQRPISQDARIAYVPVQYAETENAIGAEGERARAAPSSASAPARGDRKGRLWTRRAGTAPSRVSAWRSRSSCSRSCRRWRRWREP